MSAGPERSGDRPLARAFDELLRVPLGRDVAATSAAPHVRSRASTDRSLLLFVAAASIALAVGCWALGAELLARASEPDVDALSGWRGGLAAALPASRPDWLAAFVLGLGWTLPLLVVAVVVAAFWELVFATLRRRAPDPGWLMSASLFTALLPAAMPLPAAALGLSFGLVFGSHIFGGTGRYLLSPALLGVVFLNFAYPGLFGPDRWLPGFAVEPTWTALAANGAAGLVDAGKGWLAVFGGREIGALGTSSALACLVGAAALVGARVASWRTLVGGVLGVALVSALCNAVGTSTASQIPWHWHLATGSFAFGLAFVATDPTTMPLTVAGRWLHGLAVGALVVLLRVVNPEHPEATLFALVIAGLFTPLFDHVAVAARIRAARRGAIS